MATPLQKDQHMKDKYREEWHWMFSQLSTSDKILIWLYLRKLLARRAMIVRVEKAKAGAARVVRAFKK
jgi:hypothetical protein